MVRVLSFLLIIFCGAKSYPQNENTSLLKTFINDSSFCKYVLASCSNCDTIVVIDTLNYFSDQVIYANSIKIVIKKKYSDRTDFPKNVDEIKKWPCMNLIITQIIRKRNRYRISYSHSPSNGIGFIEYQLRNKKFLRVDSQFGQF